MAVEYRVLGPLEVLVDGVVVPVPAGRCRVLLATLLLRPKQVVSVNELAERLWDGEPPTPDRVHKTVQMVVVRLRQALGEASCVRTTRGGYRAEVDPAALDLTRFRQHLRSGDFAAATELWRGPVLSDVKSSVLHQYDVPPVTEEWLRAVERRIGAELDAGQAAELVAELRALTTQHPFREAFWGQLMLALAQSGQQAQALAAYQEIRTLLVDEFGVDPGDELRAVHQRVLSSPVAARGPVPRQLPTAALRFVGRSSELRGLTDLMNSDELTVAAITGTAGVGKTTLAVHWGRGVADRFPDGQLYVNLRGYDRHREPMAPDDALSRFLEALGVAPDRIPADLDAQAALYRSLIAGRRMFVLLDNARDADHVRPLLPGPSPSLVLITSRDRLTGLIVNEGAQELALDVLSDDEAHALLVSRLGEARVGAADELIKWCGGLPLALAIVAARAAQSPKLPISALVAELADECTRLDTLDTGDAATSVRTVFQWSYQKLSSAAARMFRLLGVHPGPDITVPAAASLAGLTHDETRGCVRELVRANLLVEHVAGRFTCHDLLRVYAADRAEAEEPAGSRAEAVERMFDHYLHTLIDIDVAHNAGVHLHELVLEPARGVAAERPVDRPAADDWFRAESNVLGAIMAQAAQLRSDRYVWQLPWFAFDLIDRVGRWHDWIWVVEAASAVVSRLGDPLWTARLLFVQAITYGRVGRFEDGRSWFDRSSRLYRDYGRVAGQVRALNGVAWTLAMLGRPREALQVAKDALALLRADMNVTPQQIGMAMHQVASALIELGEHQEALACCGEWEATAGTAMTPDWLGLLAQARAESYLGLGAYDRAVQSCHQALEEFEHMGASENVANTHKFLGEAHRGLGDITQARHWWTKALDAYEFNEHPDAEKVRAKLAGLPEN